VAQAIPKPVQLVDIELTEADIARDKREMERTWRRPKGLWGFLVETDHKVIGLRYIITAFIFFLFGGIEAALSQLAIPDHCDGAGWFLIHV